MRSGDYGTEQTIYLAGLTGHPIHKLGRTSDLTRRLALLRPEFPGEPVPVWTVPGIANVETAIERYLWKRGYGARGREWFTFGDEDPAEVVATAYATVGAFGVDPLAVPRAAVQPWEEPGHRPGTRAEWRAWRDEYWDTVRHHQFTASDRRYIARTIRTSRAR